MSGEHKQSRRQDLYTLPSVGDLTNGSEFLSFVKKMFVSHFSVGDRVMVRMPGQV